MMERLLPGRPGAAVDEILTPALVIDLDSMEANIAAMAQHAKRSGINLRPHGKAHKSPHIARLQIAAGAVGICCQKLSEAEAFVAGGIADVLLSNEIIQPHKIERLAQLAQLARITVCVDSPQLIEGLQQAVRKIGSSLEVLIEVDVGHGRCGVQSAAEVLRLAHLIAADSFLKLRGLQAYHGAAQHYRKPEERTAAIGKAVQKAAAIRGELAAAGFAITTISGGGTGTCALESASGVYTEIQPGSYVFMDADYARNEPPPQFRHSLTIRTTVISAAVSGQIVVDAGYKAMAVDSGRPRPCRSDVEILGMSDEHTVLRQSLQAPLALGDHLDFIPGHIDPTVNLHDWYVAVRRGRIEAMWPIAARSAGL